MGTCRACKRESNVISDRIGFCKDCIKTDFPCIWPEIKKQHNISREMFQLPNAPPNSTSGVKCNQCLHTCKIPENGIGFCGTRHVEGGRLKGGRPHEGNLYYYHDPLPTNCVGSFVCPGCSDSGFPNFSKTPGPEYGYKNLAVFYHSCSFNCLYCQNYHFKSKTFSQERLSSKALADAVDSRTTCICFFGGDPTPQILHAIKSSKIAIKRHSLIRICWETNGAMDRRYLEQMAELSLKSGGCIKFDLKAWDERIHYALCGVSNKRTLDNFASLSTFINQRPELPFLIASILLVPGYVDEHEVRSIASFIAELNRDIPLSLLGFYPHFFLDDLPCTSKAHAIGCRDIAIDVGLKTVHIGNYHLLGNAY